MRFSFIFAILALAVNRVHADYADVVLADEPVAYWRLDDSDESALVEETGNVAVGEYINLGGLELESPGAIVGEDGTSVLFSESFGFGCGGLCGRGAAPVGGNLDLGTTVSGLNVTLEAWFQLTPNGEEVLPLAAFPRIFHYNNGDFGQYSFGVVGDDNAGFPATRTVWGARGDGSGSSSNILAAPSNAIESSDAPEWYHLVALLAGDGTLSDGSKIRLFLNGLEQMNLTESDPIFWQAPQASIGARLQNDEATVVQSFPGLLDEVAVYVGELTQEQILEHYLVGIGQLAGLDCDFDFNGTCDIGDIDALMTVVGEETHLADFDLTADGLVDDQDRDAWLVEASDALGFAGTILLGDANLDGTVDANDLNALALTWQTDNHRWSAGNFTGGNSDVADLNALALNWQSGIRAAAATVPEPSGSMIILMLGLIASWRWSRQR